MPCFERGKRLLLLLFTTIMNCNWSNQRGITISSNLNVRYMLKCGKHLLSFVQFGMNLDNLEHKSMKTLFVRKK